MKNSLLVKKNIKIVNKEYRFSSKFKSEYKKVKWASSQSMLNRFKLTFKLLKQYKINTWIDVGSGTGSFFSMADKSNFITDERCGVELNKELFFFSKKKKYKYQTKFKNCDIIKTKNFSKYDLVTAIGILQNCGHNPNFFLTMLIKKIKKNGLIFLTTKNINWLKFKNKNFLPNNSHSWFDSKDIVFFLKKSGIKVLKKSGFLPKSGRIVKEELSHTFFILGKKLK